MKGADLGTQLFKWILSFKAGGIAAPGAGTCNSLWVMILKIIRTVKLVIIMIIVKYQ